MKYSDFVIVIRNLSHLDCTQAYHQLLLAALWHCKLKLVRKAMNAMTQNNVEARYIPTITYCLFDVEKARGKLA